jgi:RNA 3'-terminal phosphate cyclase (ATP)
VIAIDGAEGEGGGQVLRTALALSLVTGARFRIDRIRAGRQRPGLLRQHLTAVRAAAAVGRAEVTGDEIGSQALSFAPRGIEPGRHRFAVGTAGSATLVLQTVLPALCSAGGPSELELAGGTHNPAAPPFDFLARCYLPLVSRMGPAASAELGRAGFYPRGGGRFEVRVTPAPLCPLELTERGRMRRPRAAARVAGLPRHIAEREAATLSAELAWARDAIAVEELDPTWGPGNVLVVELESDALTEVVTGFGEKGVRAEEVARRAARETRRYLRAGVPVGLHLADQLLLLLAVTSGGSFETLAPTLHTRTQMALIPRFLPVVIDERELDPDRFRLTVRPRGSP